MVSPKSVRTLQSPKTYPKIFIFWKSIGTFQNSLYYQNISFTYLGMGTHFLTF